MSEDKWRLNQTLSEVNYLTMSITDLSQEYHAYEAVDKSEFQRSARLLQSIWRVEQEYEVGELKGKNGIRRRLGSRLSMPWAQETLANYLNENIRDVFRDEVMNPKKSKGKLYAKPRIFNDLLSSQPLCFNLFSELKRDLSLATDVFGSLAPGTVGSVLDIEFEWSPGKGDPRLTGDRSAFDVYVTFTCPKGLRGFLGIEVKYHENLRGRPANLTERHFQIASQMGCFKRSCLEQMKRQPLQQMWRDHLLAGIHKIANQFEEGFFVFLYPEGNIHCSDAVNRYNGCLTNRQSFVPWTLESFCRGIKRHTDKDWIDLFIDRYMNFEKISAYAR